jgi:very-short-patch-repair endonuclease
VRARDKERALLKVAEPQLGVFSRSQALQCGYNKHSVARRISDGRWRLVYPGVFGLPGSPSTRRQAIIAACLWAGPASAVSHRTAASLFGIYQDDREFIDVSTHRKLRSPSRSLFVHTTIPLAPRDITYLGPLPATVIDLTIMGLAAHVDLVTLQRSVDDALRKGLVSLARLRWRLGQLGRCGRNGTANMRVVLDARPHGYRVTDSRLEDAFVSLVDRYGIPQPQRQKYVRRLGRVDFVYHEAEIAIELDSYEHHWDRSAFQSDRTRSNRLGLSGWLVLRYTWDDIHLRPDQVAAELRGGLRMRSPRSAISAEAVPER